MLVLGLVLVWNSIKTRKTKPADVYQDYRTAMGGWTWFYCFSGSVTYLSLIHKYKYFLRFNKKET